MYSCTTPTLLHSYTLTLSHSYTPTLPHSYTLTLLHSYTLLHSHIFSHSYTTLTLSHSHTLCPPCRGQGSMPLEHSVDFEAELNAARLLDIEAKMTAFAAGEQETTHDGTAVRLCVCTALHTRHKAPSCVCRAAFLREETVPCFPLVLRRRAGVRRGAGGTGGHAVRPAPAVPRPTVRDGPSRPARRTAQNGNASLLITAAVSCAAPAL